jgi:hypothetical protein
VGIAHRDAHLPDAAQAFFDQALVTAMERLIATDEQRRRLLRIERRPQLG